MKKLLAFSLAVLALASCGDKEETFAPPQIHNFDIRPDGEILVYGKGMEVLRKFHPTYEFSLGFHEYMPETDFQCKGEHVLVVNDTTLIINPEKIQNIHLLCRYPDSLNPEVRQLISDKPIVAGQAFDMNKANARNLFKQLSASDQDCAMWLLLKDKNYQFWETADPSQSSFTIGFYRIWRLQYINEAADVKSKSFKAVKAK